MPAYMFRLKYSSDIAKYIDSAPTGLDPSLLGSVLMGLEAVVDKTRLPVPIPSRDTLHGDVDPAHQDYLVPCTVGLNDADGFLAAARALHLDVFFNPPVTPAGTCELAPIGTARDVQALLNAPALLASGLDGSHVLLAIVDTGINLQYLQERLAPYGIQPQLSVPYSYSENPKVAVGQASPDSHGTMVAFDALLAAPRATLIDQNWTKPATSSTQPLAYDAMDVLGVYFRLRSVRYQVSMGLFPNVSMVVNNSWAVASFAGDAPAGDPANYSHNPKHPLMWTVEFMTNEGIDFVFGAGNCGPDCPSGYCSNITQEGILGIHASPDVLTVGAIATSLELAGYSQRGPGSIEREKPDLVAWSHFAGCRPAPGSDNGTSTSAPVAAGVIAAYRTLHPYTKGCDERAPREVFELLRKTARPIGSLGWDPGYGFGIIDPLAFLKACHRPDPTASGKLSADGSCACPCGVILGGKTSPGGTQSGRGSIVSGAPPRRKPRASKHACCCCCPGSHESHVPVPAPASSRLGLFTGGLLQTSIAPTPWTDIPWTDIPWTDIPWTDIPWTDIPWTDIPWTDIPWTDIPWTDIPWTDIEHHHGKCGGGGGCCGGGGSGCCGGGGCGDQTARRWPQCPRPCGCR